MSAAIPSRFADLRPGVARLLLAVIAGLMLLGILLSSAPGRQGPRLASAGLGDATLYRTIVKNTATTSGLDGYYQTAISAQRASGYPVKPFVTVREPALALVSALLGQKGTLLLFRILALTTLITFVLRLRDVAGRGAWLGGSMILAVSIALLSQPVLALWHEAWAALLVCLSLACRSTRRWLPACALGLAAALVRELAMPYLLAMLVASITERRRSETMGWVVTLALFIAAMTIHAVMVSRYVVPGDPHSPGWTTLGGWAFILSMVHNCSAMMIAPLWASAILVPLALLGWAAPSGDFADRVALTLLAWIAMFMLIGRPDNFYWGLLLAPLLPVGLAFAPRAIADLARAAIAERAATIA